MKKILKIILFGVLGFIVIAGVLMWLEFGPLVKGAMSCEKLDDGLYYIEYRGDDGFEELIRRGGFGSADQLASYARVPLERTLQARGEDQEKRLRLFGPHGKDT